MRGHCAWTIEGSTPMNVYFQLGTIIGAVVGWVDGRPGRGDPRAAIVALPVGATLICVGWALPQHALVLTSLGAIAIGYGLAFVVRRAREQGR
jgi:hypothetical protein